MRLDLQAHPLLVSFCVLALIFVVRAASYRVTRKLPPGPRGTPFLGNIFQLSLRPWEKFEIWKKQYGSLVYISVAGQGILIINTHEAAFELLNRRGGNYSERPRFVVAAEILTGGLLMALVSYGKLWRRYSRAAHEALYSMQATHHYSIYSKEAILLTGCILRNPSNWENEIGRALASTTLSIVYDLPRSQCTRDSIVETLDKFTNVFLRTALSPAGQLVELFPWMKYTPSWMAKWKRDAEEGFQRHSQVLERLFNDVENRINKGEECSCFVATLIREQHHLNLNKSQATWLPAAMYIGGSETVSNVVMWFMLAMIAYPEKQRKCQEELDAVVGRSRMPTFQDRESLPYLRATIREALRWRATAPFGFPHCVKEDDWYNGLFIPKGTMCLANIWSLNRDRTIYGDDADDFNPDRFIDEQGQLLPALKDTKDEGHVSFGFGPRLCLGRQMTNNVLFIKIASILWATDIKPLRDQAGNPILPDTLNTVNDGIVARPPPFKCSITPRFPEVMSIISQTMEGL